MFRNKALVVNVVKKADIEEPQETREDDIHITTRAAVLLDNAVIGCALLIGAYFAADTLRGVAIHTAITKIK